MRRMIASLREAVERLFSPYTTSEQLLDALRRVEGIRTAADLSERRWLETQLRQAQKLETVGQLAGGIAHDFNNILAVILANTEMLRSSLPSDRPDLSDSVDKIRAAASGGASMVRGLLTFSRRADLTFTTLDLREVVANIGQMVRALLPDDVEIKIVVPPAACPVRGDASALQQLLLNLVTNARDAMPSGGTLRHRGDAASHRPELPRVGPVGERGRVLLRGGERHGRRDGPGDRREDLRAVLHDQGARRRHGAGDGDGLRHRQAARRLRSRLQRARHRDVGEGLPAEVRGRRGRGDGGGARRRSPTRAAARRSCWSRTGTSCAARPDASSSASATRSSRPPTARTPSPSSARTADGSTWCCRTC